MPHRIFHLMLAIVVAMYSARSNAAQIEISVADIVSPAFSATSISVTFFKNGSANLRIAEMRIAEKKLQKVNLHCAEFRIDSERVLCRDGRLDRAAQLPFTLAYEFATQKLELRHAATDEMWQLQANFHARPWLVKASLHNARVSRIATLLPEGFPLPGNGLMNGQLEMQGGKEGVSVATADIQLKDIAFSDASGLHAGEKLNGTISIYATHSEQLWDSRVSLDWQSGDLFWQPLFLHGGHSLTAQLQWDGAQLKLAPSNLNVGGVGSIELDGLWDVAAKQMVDANASGKNLELKSLFADFAKPFLGGGMLADSEMSGTADLSFKYSKGATQEVKIGLHDVALIDEKKRLSLYKLNADIPWQAAQVSQARLSFDSGALWGVPLGATALEMTMGGLDFTIPDASIPVLDGKLSVHDFHLHHELDEWRWEFSGGLTPVSMSPLSAALGWPQMKGALSGMIPQVKYQNKVLKVDGALLFRVFDGSMVVSSLELFDPFGPAPRLYGNLDMRELDLGALTQAFSFGNVQGRIDVKVKDLELVNWQAVRFDARVSSSPGNYRKKISQKAVQNISALGGSGAAAAVQRSVMSVFENFGYDRIVLSCVLRNGVCLMDGAESTANGYYIVKGWGIPAINVMGYNHEVDWNELLTRLKRVIQGNMKAEVR